MSGLVLVDANVLLDVLTDDPVWSERSGSALARVADDARLAINPIVYAEVSIGFDRIEELDDALPRETFARLPLPWAAAFLAGKCFVRYRRSGSSRRSPLPDFYIGAHAAIEGLPLLTRDEGRYRTYLPRLELVTPQALDVLGPGDSVPDVQVWTAPREEPRPLREVLGAGYAFLCFYLWDWSPT